MDTGRNETGAVGVDEKDKGKNNTKAACEDEFCEEEVGTGTGAGGLIDNNRTDKDKNKTAVGDKNKDKNKTAVGDKNKDKNKTDKGKDKGKNTTTEEGVGGAGGVGNETEGEGSEVVGGTGTIGEEEEIEYRPVYFSACTYYCDTGFYGNRVSGKCEVCPPGCVTCSSFLYRDKAVC